MSEIKYTELDFAKIKENLKTYLKSQNKFRDYDFDASGLSILLDILAYNTAYNGFYLNMLASEMFLDSAHMRESVVSRAKHLGYTPSSKRALSAVIDIEFDFSKNDDMRAQSPGVPFLIETDDELYCLVDSSRHVFYPKYSVFAQPLGDDKYLAKDVIILQGKRLTYTWTVDEFTKTFVIPNGDIDLSTLNVYVSPSSSSSTRTKYLEFKDLTELTPDDEVYFIQEATEGKFEIIFGDGVLGKKLEVGNVVSIEYVVPGTGVAVGASKFYPSSSRIGSFVEKTKQKLVPKEAISVIRSTVAARDYGEKESVESIKYKAPRMYTTQNRAITKNDYDVLLKKDISTIDPKIEHIRVWGGEENTPPDYGKVFLAIKPTHGIRLNEQEKQSIIDNYIRPKNVISVEPVIVDPDYIGLVVSCTINYFASKTKNSENQIKSLVYGKISQFRDTTIAGFDSDLRHSKLASYIDSADPSIESNITKVALKYRITPQLSTPFTKHIPLTNLLSRGDISNNVSSITSTVFRYANTDVFIGDDGKGNLVLYRKSDYQKSPLLTVGSVKYDTGDIHITGLIADSIEDNLNYIDLFVTPKYDDVIAYKNQILVLENEDILVSAVNLDYVRTS